MIPFESGHLALGGRIYRPQISYKCEMCSVAFLSYARNAKVCEKCRPMAKKIRYLENGSCEFGGLKFWGSPVQPEFMDWAFNVKRGPDIKKYWDMIPDDTDVLITHGPPWGLLDQIRPGREVEHLGCGELLKAVRRVKPKLHVFGHIHGGYGSFKEGPTQFVNASLLNEAYRPVNAPIVVEFQSEKDLVSKLPAFPLPRQKKLTDREVSLLVDMLEDSPKILGGKLSE